MKCTVLTDNIAHGVCLGEWGLSIGIEAGGRRILLDAGASGLFAENADRLGFSLDTVDAAVLSHAHFDHSDGFDTFFARNSTAKLYLRKACAENCFSGRGGLHYIGIRRGFLAEHRDRLVFADGDTELFPGIMLIPHKRPEVAESGIRAMMYTGSEDALVPETFAHEQSLVVETAAGLVIFNSCSHGGADTIIREVAETFPDKHICAMVGGFHLFESDEKTVLAFAERVKATGISRLITGHCTGDEAFALLQSVLGDRVTQTVAGYTFEIGE